MKFRSLISVATVLALAACQSSSNKPTGVNSLLPKLEKKEEPATTDDRNTASVSTLKDGEQSKASATSITVDPDIVQSYAAPQAGTVYTWRNNWANLPEIISYKVAGTMTLGGTEYIKFSSVKGFKNTTHAFYQTNDFSLKGYRDKNDKALVTFKPTEQRYKFPMGPGSQWLTSWKQIDHKSGKVTSGGGVVKALRWETLNLPAGKFRALKIKMPIQTGAPKGLTHFVWFSPKLGITIQEEIGGGVLNWSQRLEKIEQSG